MSRTDELRSALAEALPSRPFTIALWDGGTVALSVATICVLLAVHVGSRPFAYWMGGWKPQHGVTVVPKIRGRRSREVVGGQPY